MVGVAYAIAARCLAPALKDIPAADDVPGMSSFGVFVTIHRSVANPGWPHTVHGCIGHWCDDFCTLSEHELLRRAFQVGSSAFFSDPRKKYFDDIRSDAGASVEVSFMQLPVTAIDASTGRLQHRAATLFNNRDFGVIVSGNKNRATYLPGVFPDAAWSTIRDSVADKATRGDGDGDGGSSGSGTAADVRFYAYKTIVRRAHLLDIFLAAATSRSLQLAFCHTLLRGYKATAFVPYAVTATGRFVANEEQDVRNIATVVAATKYNQATYGNAELRAYLARDVATFFARIDTLSRQALVFLLPETRGQKREKICASLAARLPAAERVFEAGELRHGLATYCSRGRSASPRANANDVIANIFQWNWDSQALAADGSLKNPGTRRRYEAWALAWASEAQFKRRETNELAVFLESVTLYVTKPSDALSRAALSAFLECLNRYHDGVFFFMRPAAEARMDITVHILNGVTRHILS